MRTRRLHWGLAALIAAAGLVLGTSGTASAATPSGDAYGYVVTGSTYTSSTADWTVPAISCGSAGSSSSYISVWTGLDGYTSDTVEQIGSQSACSGPTAEYYGWYELYPEALMTFSQVVKPGDELEAAVSYAGSTFTLTLRNVTEGWSQTVRASLSGARRSSAETLVEVPASYTCATRQTLAAVTGDTVDGVALGSLSPVKVTGGNSHITVSAVSGKTFTVSCTA